MDTFHGSDLLNITGKKVCLQKLSYRLLPTGFQKNIVTRSPGSPVTRTQSLIWNHSGFGVNFLSLEPIRGFLNRRRNEI
jgi:hypothetical protein